MRRQPAIPRQRCVDQAIQVGWAAVNGLMAATLVREGFKGASEALEGKHGFMRAYAPNPKPERACKTSARCSN